MTNIFATAAINIMALVILSRRVFGNNILASQRKKPFFFGIILTIVVMLAEVGTILASNGGAAWRSLNLVSNAIGFMITPFIPVVLLAIFDSEVLKTRLYLLLAALLNGIAALLSPFFGFLFTVDAANRYARGSLFVLFVTVYMIQLLCLAFVTLRKGRRHLHLIQWNMVGLTLFIVAGTFVQLVFPMVYTAWHSVTLALMLYYLLLLEFDGRFDSLTGLYNRSAFEKDIRHQGYRRQCTVIVMDVNDFKQINDTYGHEYGDAVLQTVAETIRESFDLDCSCYRIGGDEFSVLCRYSDPERIDRQLKSMTSRLAGERKHDRCLPTVAYGHSASETAVSDVQVMLKAADAEMYHYKQMQKSRKDVGDDKAVAESISEGLPFGS